ALQQFHDRRRVQSTHPAKKPSPLQQLHIGGRVHSILAFGSPRTRQSEVFPGPDHRRRHSHLPCHVPDLQIRVGIGRVHTPAVPCHKTLARRDAFFVLDSTHPASLTLR